MASSSRFSVPRGMRDFYPPEMARRTRIFDAWAESARRFGFERYDSCVVETLDLLKRKGGEEIVDQIYAFKDKSGRDLALRPEMTPTLARMIAAQQGSLSYPLKWYAIAQCFRYERTTRGRKREHYQWNLDVIGEPAVTAECEVIASAVDAMRTLGVPDETYEVRINSRALLSEIFRAYEIPADKDSAVFLALDKRGKVDDLSGLLRDAGLSDDQIAKANELSQIASVDDAASVLNQDSDAVEQLREVMNTLDVYGIAKQVRFDMSVIRGLGYYTGIVFEGFDTTAGLRAIFGGGRYDNLLSAVGGNDQTAVGLGFGDVVIDELLRELSIDPGASGTGVTAVGYMRSEQQVPAQKAAMQLRADGHRVDLALHPEKPKAFFSRADRTGCSQAAYIGPDDVDAASFRLKALATREETRMPLA